jgi:hypothetical protein
MTTKHPKMEFEPKFGLQPHTIESIDEALKTGKCRNCGSGAVIPEGSDFVCMTCHRVAPNRVAACRLHFPPKKPPSRREFAAPGEKVKKKAKKKKLLAKLARYLAATPEYASDPVATAWVQANR